jgi:hypothetical protein
MARHAGGSHRAHAPAECASARHMRRRDTPPAVLRNRQCKGNHMLPKAWCSIAACSFMLTARMLICQLQVFVHGVLSAHACMHELKVVTINQDREP